MADIRISDPSILERAYTGIVDPSKIQFIIADVQAATPGTPYKVTAATLPRITEYRIITVTSHGLISGDVGKPLADDFSVLDDTDNSNRPAWVLVQVIDTDNIRVAPRGEISFADTLMEVGWDFATDGPNCYWDASLGKYTAARPADSATNIPQVIRVSYVSGSTVYAEVLGATYRQVGPVQPWDQVVDSSSSVSAAVAALNAQGYGTLWLDGEVSISATHSFTGPIDLLGLDGNSSLRVTNAAAQFRWGEYWDPSSGTTYTIKATTAHAQTIDCPDIELTPGEWVALWSDDNLTDVAPHLTYQRAQEFHQIFNRHEVTPTVDYLVDDQLFNASNHKLGDDSTFKFKTGTTPPSPFVVGTTYHLVSSTSSTFKLSATQGGAAITFTDNGTGALTGETSLYYLGDFIVDALSTNPTLARANVYSQPDADNVSNVTIGNFTVRQDAGITHDRLFDVRRLNGLTMKGITWEQSTDTGGPGHALFNFCSNVLVEDIRVLGVDQWEASAAGYLIVAAAVNGFTLTKSFSRKCRHFFTTTSSMQTGSTRWGTPRNVEVSHNHLICEGNESTANASLDAHAEGYGIIFDSNRIVCSGRNVVNYAFTTRARHTIYTNNKIYGGASYCKGVITNSRDCVIKDNLFDGCWISIQILNAYGAFDQVVIDNNDFFDNDGNSAPVISITNGNDHLITRNTFLRADSGCIKILTGDGIKIMRNDFIDIGSTDTEAIISFQGTGDQSSGDARVMFNTFVSCGHIGVEFLGGATVTAVVYGNDNAVCRNEFYDCGTTSLVKFVDDGTTTGHRVMANTMSQMTNANSLDTGSLAAAAITLRGNVMDQYGPGSMGMTGTNAGTINTNQAAYNWTD